MSALTGKTRHRSVRSILGRELLVLQVEEKHAGSVCQFDFTQGPSYTAWRDAVTSDLPIAPAQQVQS